MIIEKDNPNLPFISPFLHIIHNLHYGNFSDAVKGYIAHKFDVQRISEVVGLIKNLGEELYLFRHKEFNHFFDNYFDINTIEEIFDLRREVTIDLIEEVVYSIKFLSLVQTAERDKTTVLLEQQYQRITEKPVQTILKLYTWNDLGWDLALRQYYAIAPNPEEAKAILDKHFEGHIEITEPIEFTDNLIVIENL